MSARSTVCVMKRSTATTVPTASSALRARSWSGRSTRTSAPSSTSTSMSPAAAASRAATQSSPVEVGVPAQQSSNRLTPVSRVVRPGSRPGDIPMSSAPCTFPRRSSDRNLTPSTFSRMPTAASATRPASSASEVRPSRTVTGPPAETASPTEPRLPDPPSNMARTTPAASPGRTRMECVAMSARPVGWGSAR